jgi:hypothetical protein
MVSLSSGYNPPGVYVSSDSSSVSGVVGVQPTVACLVGPGLGYQTNSDTLVFASLSTPLVLTQLGIQQSSVAVSYVDGNGTSHVLALGTDYTLSATDGSYPDTVTTITPLVPAPFRSTRRSPLRTATRTPTTSRSTPSPTSLR